MTGINKRFKGWAAVMMMVMVAVAVGAGGCESKQARAEREARKAKDAREREAIEERAKIQKQAEKEMRERMALSAVDAEERAQQHAEGMAKAEAERKAKTGWYTDNPNASEFSISNADQLAGMAELVNGGDNFYGKTIKLTADVDLSAYGKGAEFNGGKGWVPINGFGGTFDGNGKKIRGLYISDNSLDGAGLFGHNGAGSNGTVKNLGVVDVNIAAGKTVGGIVGGTLEAFTLTNCYVTGTVSGRDQVGGVIGLLSSTITNCYFTGTVKGNDYVGGLVGKVNGVIGNSYSSGTVNGNNKVGGIVGSVDVIYGDVGGGIGGGGGINNCYSTAAVVGNSDVGGIVGEISETKTALYDDDTSEEFYNNVQNSAALNPSVKGRGSNIGRVIGNNRSKSSNNIAFSDLKDQGDQTDRWTVKAPDQKDGADITPEEISSDPTLGGRFKDKAWKTESGKLPGLGGKAVALPAHLK